MPMWALIELFGTFPHFSHSDTNNKLQSLSSRQIGLLRTVSSDILYLHGMHDGYSMNVRPCSYKCSAIQPEAIHPRVGQLSALCIVDRLAV